MLETILKTIKRSALVAGLYIGVGMVGAGCDCSSGVPGAGGKGCVDEDNDTFYSQMDCGSEVDCDDHNNAIFPGATEFCNYKDDNCNGEADEGEGIARTYCADQDKDGFGDPKMTKRSCFNLEDAPDGENLEGYVNNCNDCDDTDVNKWQILSGYADNDGDGFAVGELQEFCVGDNLSPGYVGNPKSQDCDDTNAGIWQFLSGYVDGDGDSYSVGEMQQICSGENLPTSYTATPLGEDCNDQSASVWQNVSGYVDNDGDGDGINPMVTVCAGVEFPEGYSSNNWDCDDANPLVNDGTTQDICCGYDGQGTRSRFCSAGQWTVTTLCSIDNFINGSNNVTGAVGGSGEDKEPAIDIDWLVFTSARIGYPKIFSINVCRKEGCEEDQPECLSCNLPEPSGIDCDVWSPCDWLSPSCYTGSLFLIDEDNNDDLDGRVGFECTWIDDDDASGDDPYHNFVYTLNPKNFAFEGYLNLWGELNERPHSPIVNDYKLVTVVNGDIRIRDAENGGCWGLNGCNFSWNGLAAYPDVSGDYVAFMSTQSSDDNTNRVYLKNTTTGSISQPPVSGLGLNQNGYQPSIHANDVVFTSQAGGVKHLYHYDIGTGTLTTPSLTPSCGNNYEPDVHGRRVAFTSERDGNKEVYVCDLEQTVDCCAGAVNISNHPADDYDPSISTCKVAYVTEQTTDKEIFVYDLCEGGCSGE